MAGRPVASATITLPLLTPVSSVATLPRPKFVLAVTALFKSLKLFKMANLVESVEVTPVSCEPSITGRPVASATITLPFATPVVRVATLPRPRFVLAVVALSRSLKLLVVIKTLVGSVLSILSIFELVIDPPISALIRRWSPIAHVWP